MTTANPGDREHAKLGDPDQPRRGRRPADTFANRLVLAQRLTGLTIREFAQAAELDDASVSNWMRGMRPRDLLDVAGRIADAHDIDEQWLIWGGELAPTRGRRDARTVRSDNEPYRRPPSRPADTRPAGRPLVRSAETSEVRRSRIIRIPATEARSRLVAEGSRT